MANARKIKCDCGKELEAKDTIIEQIPTEALVCSGCGFTTLTKEQAKKFSQQVELHRTIDQERQVIKIGNSMGITLPEKFREYGVNVGRKIKIEAIDKHSFKVVL